MTDQSKDRIGGAFDEAKGRVKEGVGDATGDQSTRNEGMADQASGKVKQGVADAKDKVDDLVKNVTDGDKNANR